MTISLFFIAIVAQASFSAAPTPPPATGGSSGTSVRITSPLGRSGVPGTIRIVAQISPALGAELGPVKFLIDGKLLETDSDGAPYAVEWVDENPFERREISVAVEDALGREATDRVVLEPFEILEETQVRSVLVEAAVQDPRGRFVKSLAPGAFRLLEDGVPQTIDLAQHETVGGVFALLIDSSASMSRRLPFVQRAAARLGEYMTAEDRTIVAPFSKRLLATTGPTDDRKTVDEAISSIRASGGTAILDSLIDLSRTLPESNGRRAIILITDGYDENSQANVDEVIAALKASRVTVYSVAIGGVAGISLKGEKVLRRIAQETGGRVFLPANDEQLEQVHTALVDDVQNRYVLTYTPANQKHDGRWREIMVQLTDPGRYRVSARPGYFAPKPAPVRPTLEFTVTDPQGRYLDVSADDLEVLEDGVPQRVDTFHEATQPVSIILALDASGSMRKREGDVIASARAFAEALRPQDELGIMLFADEAKLVHDLATNREGTQRAINEYKTHGGTALYDALSEALTRLQRVEGRRVVVLMTDGRDENNPGNGPGSKSTLPEVLTRLTGSGVTVFTLGLGARVDVTPLQQFADISGGRILLPEDVSQLAGEFARVVEDLRRRYLIAYTSSNGERDGAWRNVTIRVKSADGAQVRSHGGYSAPER